MEKVTIHTIAEACHVSIGTVDRALNGRGRIRPETKQQILETAMRLGYHRNKLASVLSRKQEYRIAVLTPRSPSFFFEAVDEGVAQAERDLLDYGVVVERFHTEFLDDAEQLAVLETLDKTRFHGLVLTAASDRLADSLRAFSSAGVTVATFNSDAEGSGRLFFVGENAERSGRMCGALMGRFLGGKGRVAVLASYLTPGSPAKRVQGFLYALHRDFPSIEVIETAEYHDRVDAAGRMAGELTARYGPVNGVFTNSASGTVGVGRHFAAADDAAKPILIGYDVTPEVYGYLKSGVCDAVIDQSPQKQSYYAVTLLGRHLYEGWRPEHELLELRAKLVLRDNADDYIDRPGDRRSILL